jgi:RND family efflux transporter MFP subunit
MSSTASQHAPKILTKRHIGWGVMMLALIGGIAFLVNGPFSSFFASSTSAGEGVANTPKPLPVNVAEIEFVESITQSRSYTGTIRARRRSDLGFELPGKIISINVDEGDTVTEGQVLAELDTETLNAQRGATAARLAQAHAVLDELNAGPRPEKIRAAKATMEAAESQFDGAVSNLKRRELAYEAGAISDEEIDQARFAKKTAQANLNAAQEQLFELEAGTRQEKLAGQRSAVQQLEAEAKEIEVAIAKSKLIAPFTGTVTRRYLDPGSIAQVSSPVIKLVEQQNLEAWIGLPVTLAADLELGTRHEILINGRAFFGVSSAKIQELDPTTRTQTVLFELEPEASNYVVSGQLCEIQISSSVDSSGCWVPTSALAKGIRGLWSVLVIVPDESGQGFRVEKRDIDIIKTDSNRVLAKGTIQNGDLIIVNGVHRVGEGQLVVPSDDE